MALRINSLTVPTSIANSVRPTPNEPAEVRRNGRGEIVTAGLSSQTWTFDVMSQSDFDWFYTTICLAAPSRYVTNNRLLTKNMAEADFASAVVKQPTWESFNAGLYYGVTVEIYAIQV